MGKVRKNVWKHFQSAAGLPGLQRARKRINQGNWLRFQFVNICNNRSSLDNARPAKDESGSYKWSWILGYTFQPRPKTKPQGIRPFRFSTIFLGQNWPKMCAWGEINQKGEPINFLNLYAFAIHFFAKHHPLHLIWIRKLMISSML